MSILIQTMTIGSATTKNRTIKLKPIDSGQDYLKKQIKQELNKEVTQIEMTIYSYIRNVLH